MMFYVYVIENLNNGKLYVGKTNNLDERWGIHKTKARGGPQKYKDFYHIHKALRKYKDNINENFHFYPIECFSTEIEALLAEIYWIKYLKEQNIILYNLTNGGEGVSGMKVSGARRKKMSEQRKGKLAGKNHPLYGKHHSKESREKISKNRIGRYGGSNNPMYGRKGEDAPCFNRIGEKHPNCKITNQQLLEIKELISLGNKTLSQIARDYNVCVSTISQIKNNKSRQKFFDVSGEIINIKDKKC